MPLNVSRKLAKELSCYTAYKNDKLIKAILSRGSAYVSRGDSALAYIRSIERREDINYVCKACKERKMYLKKILECCHGNKMVHDNYNFKDHFDICIETYQVLNFLDAEDISREFLKNCLFNCKRA